MSTVSPAPLLSKPLNLPCGATLSNRIAKSALSETLGTRDEAPSPELITLFDRWARSGAGLLLTGNVMIDRQALGEPGNVAIEDDRHHSELAAWAAAATRGGAHAWVQLNHPGRQSPRRLSPRPVAPSAIAVDGAGKMFATPRELTEPEIYAIVERFATAAEHAVSAGFTGIQIHGAHGYLVSQFLSPLANVRTDRWGGSPEARRRFLLEIVRACRERLGPEVPISVKLNSADFQRGGFDEGESLEVVQALGDESVDLLEVSGGTYESAAMMGVHAKTSTRAREAYFLDFAEKVRGVSGIPLMVTGGFRTTAGMQAAIASGAVDVVGMGRPLITEPDLPGRLLAGLSTASAVRPRSLGIKKLDGFVEILWYGSQIRRLGSGQEIKSYEHPALTLATFAAKNGKRALRRPRRGL